MKTANGFKQLGMRALSLLEPEHAKELGLFLLSRGIGVSPPDAAIIAHARLNRHVAGLRFRNPLGLAAGLDRNAELLDVMVHLGFGFIETGSVTLHPQDGNPGPRLFRLPEDRAFINRLGFPGKGAAHIARQLTSFRLRTPDCPALIGVNLGLNRATDDPKGDYARCSARFAKLADYLTINVSSPNTEGLRALQKIEILAPILDGVRNAIHAHSGTGGVPPLFVKLSPDLAIGEFDAIIGAVIRYGLADGLILGNTTTRRPSWLRARARTEQGGLSGHPLREISLDQTRHAAGLTDGKLAIISTGGIFSGADAFDRLEAGADLLQFYTGFVYRGPDAVHWILHELLNSMEIRGRKGKEMPFFASERNAS